MKLSVVRRARVAEDLREHYSYIARDKIAPAERLLVVAEESYQRLAENPCIGRVWESRQVELHGVRFYPMPAPYRNYVIFYRVTETRLEVLAILHGARNSEYVLREIVD